MSTTLLVNQVEQIQPNKRNDTVIVLYCRKPEKPGERFRVNVYGFDPYFYTDRLQPDEVGYALQNESIKEIERVVDESAFPEDRELSRVYTQKPQDVRQARELFDQTYAADVPFTNRFRIDTGVRDVIEIPDPPSDDASEIDVSHREIEPVVVASSGG